ncbi:MAG: RNA polymerase sigma-70 factor [Bacteroidota bacterium]|nr:RNA polymerase sigma-70 factor [Bacteroidota bacterium]
MEKVLPLHTDLQLMEQLKQGDDKALEILYKKYYISLTRFANNILKDKVSAEDMVQEVFMKIWNNCDKIEINSSLKAYLFTATRNQCFNLLKKVDRNVMLEEALENEPRLSVNDVEERLAAKSLKLKIQEAIELLPEKCKLTFQLSRFEEMSYKEIAETMDVSVKTVENQMGKALAILRLHLKPFLQNGINVLLTGLLQIFLLSY